MSKRLSVSDYPDAIGSGLLHYPEPVSETFMPIGFSTKKCGKIGNLSHKQLQYIVGVLKFSLFFTHQRTMTAKKTPGP
jgi:hypothetical protein